MTVVRSYLSFLLPTRFGVFEFSVKLIALGATFALFLCRLSYPALWALAFEAQSPFEARNIFLILLASSAASVINTQVEATASAGS